MAAITTALPVCLLCMPKHNMTPANMLLIGITIIAGYCGSLMALAEWNDKRFINYKTKSK